LAPESASHGWWAVASGRSQACLVLGAEKMGDATRGAQEVLNKIWDPAYEAALPLNTIVMCAMQAIRYMDRYGATEQHFALSAARMRTEGARNEHAHLRTPMTVDAVLATPYLAYPTRLAMACPRTTGGCAMVLVSDDLARRLAVPLAWVRGFAARANTYFMGDKMGDCGPNDHGFYHDLHLAAASAYAMAGITRPPDQVRLVEPYIPFSVMEPAQLEALGVCGPGEAPKLAEIGHFDHDGPMPCCPSGGTLCANPISVSAMVRVAEAAQQVRRRCGAHQVDGVHTALGAGAGGSVSIQMPQTTMCRIYDGVPIMWSIDQGEEMSTIVVGPEDQCVELDFFSVEALGRLVTAAKQARRRLKMRIEAHEKAIAQGFLDVPGSRENLP
jgi:acetyl-CoA C-acetyltransferase